MKLTNPRLQYNQLKIHFRHGYHLGNHEQPKTVERKQRKKHQETTSRLRGGDRVGRVGGRRRSCEKTQKPMQLLTSSR
jgi:hypothetical protein